MFINRHILPYLDRMKNQFKVLLITGSRQVGKSTLLKEKLVSDYEYVTLDDYNELAQNMKMKSDTVVIQGMALDLIKRNYGIDYSSSLNGDVRTVHIQGNKVDSALILLPYYRHKLFYDSKTKSWIVEYQKIVTK